MLINCILNNKVRRIWIWTQFKIIQLLPNFLNFHFFNNLITQTSMDVALLQTKKWSQHRIIKIIYRENRRKVASMGNPQTEIRFYLSLHSLPQRCGHVRHQGRYFKQLCLFSWEDLSILGSDTKKTKGKLLWRWSYSSGHPIIHLNPKFEYWRIHILQLVIKQQEICPEHWQMLKEAGMDAA